MNIKRISFTIAAALLLCSAPITVLAKCQGSTCTLDNPFGTTEVTVLIGTVIKAFLGIIGSLTLLMLVWGGFLWLTSAGNQDRISKGTKTMVWAVIGVILVFSSYILVNTLFGKLTGQ